jgi:predicted Zn-dependent peptidase
MKIQKKTLSNGVRVLLISLPDNPTVTVEVLVRAGSMDESEKNQGISHFLEHMCFKGTTNRPSALHISRELESLGAQSNAYTSQNHTAYYAKSQSAHASKLLDIISDVYLNSTFPVEEIEKEKGVIIEEINMYKDQPDHQVDEEWNKLFFKTGSLSRPVIGTKETVLSFTQNDLKKYHSKLYTPKNTVVVVSGSFDEDSIFSQIKKQFSKSKLAPQPKRPKVIIPKTGDKSVVSKKTDQAHIVLGVKACDAFDEKRYATAVLSCVLGGGMSSRLFQLLREKMGVAYYVYTYFSQGREHGLFKIYAGVDKNRVHEVLHMIQSEIDEIVAHGITDEELFRAKEYIVGSMYLALESSDDFCSYFGVKEIFGSKRQMPKEREKCIRAVTTEQVKQVAKSILTQKFTTALIGDFPKDFLSK